MLSSGRSRANVAAQACDTCRRRKSRCDEVRPKCSLCQRLNVECSYREQPPATRCVPSSPVDRALTDPFTWRSDDNFSRMQETLERLEEKIDNITLTGRGSSSAGLGTSSSSNPTPASAVSDWTNRALLESPTADFPSIGQESPPYFTAPHRTLVWPSIYSELVRSVPLAGGRLAGLSEGGTSWLLSEEMSEYQARLSAEVDMPSTPTHTDRGYPSFASRTHFPTLTLDRIRSYTSAYFTTFNVIYPILDENMFMNDVLPPLLQSGFRYGDASSVLALFVLALGQLTIDSLTGAPIELVDGNPSGICGGTADHPPGLDIFNEGRARSGSLVLRGDVISVQVLLLQAAYFEANCCHVEYWRSIMEASMICQLLVQSPSAPWGTMSGDLLRRAFWSCVIDSNFYHLDLDLPGTNLDSLIDKIRLPNFSKALGNTGWSGGNKAQSLMEFYFLAKVGLLRVITRIHQAIQHYSSSFENLHDYSGPPIHVIRELSRQLDTWREQLPGALRWSDDELFDIPEEDPTASRAVDYTSGMSALHANAHETRAGAEILGVELRARFYYARFMLGRPFIFKALHFAELMNTQDAEYCVTAIRAACLWPSALAPVRHKKRLIPHLFTWTQSFIAMLCILWCSRRNEYLGRLCEERLDREWVNGVIQEMLLWIRDVRQIDGIAAWSWHFLQPLFAEEQQIDGV